MKKVFDLGTIFVIFAAIISGIYLIDVMSSNKVLADTTVVASSNSVAESGINMINDARAISVIVMLAVLAIVTLIVSIRIIRKAEKE